MDIDKKIIENNFSCRECGRRIPQIVLSVKKGKTVCNLCDNELFKETYDISEDNCELRLLEITEIQLKLMIDIIRKNVKGKINEVDQINSYWEFKTNNKYSLADSGRKTIEKFLNEFTIEEIQESIDIAFNKVNVEESGRFKYLCGILNGKIKERKHSPEYSEIIKYWNYKRPQNWKKADEGKVEYLIEKYDTTKIKFYIDKIVDEERGWADFDSLIDSLEQNKYE
jgi:hypothetical protein